MRAARRAGTICLLACAVLAGAGRPAGADGKPMELPDGAKLQVTLPEGWTARFKVTGDAGTAEISPEPGTDAKLVVTVLPDLPLYKLAKDAPSLRQMVESQGRKLLAKSMQETLTVTELRLPEGVGYIYHLTDRNPEKGPGDYREMRQGALLSGERMLTVTALSHPDDTGFVAKALDVLASVRVSADAAGPGDAGTAVPPRHGGKR